MVVFIASAADLVALSQTCRWLSNVLRQSRLLRYILDQNLANQLARFNLRIQDIQNLFSLHRGAVLSGSTVLQAYTGDHWLNSDIDLYIPYKLDIELFFSARFPQFQSNLHDNTPTSIQNVEEVIELLKTFGLPVDYFSKATIISNQYAPLHVKFMLEFEMNTLDRQILKPNSAVDINMMRKIQLIFIDMEIYPQFSDCGSIIHFFDLSIVQNYYDGSSFHSTFIQHILRREMTLTTDYNGIQRIYPPVMHRITKYVYQRGFIFLGPYLPWSAGAKEIYDEELRISNRPSWYTVSPVSPPTADVISGTWIHAAAVADPLFYDDDRDDNEIYRGHWRTQRMIAMAYRLEGRPNYILEQRLALLMPLQYRVHRSMTTITTFLPAIVGNNSCILQQQSTVLLQHLANHCNDDDDDDDDVRLSSTADDEE